MCVCRWLTGSEINLRARNSQSAEQRLGCTQTCILLWRLILNKQKNRKISFLQEKTRVLYQRSSAMILSSGLYVLFTAWKIKSRFSVKKSGQVLAIARGYWQILPSNEREMFHVTFGTYIHIYISIYAVHIQYRWNIQLAWKRGCLLRSNEQQRRLVRIYAQVEYKRKDEISRQMVSVIGSILLLFEFHFRTSVDGDRFSCLWSDEIECCVSNRSRCWQDVSSGKLLSISLKRSFSRCCWRRLRNPLPRTISRNKSIDRLFTCLPLICLS